MSSSIIEETEKYPKLVSTKGVVAVNTVATSYMGFEEALKYSKNGYKIASQSIFPDKYFKFTDGSKIDFYDTFSRSHSHTVDSIPTKMLSTQDYYIFE